MMALTGRVFNLDRHEYFVRARYVFRGAGIFLLWETTALTPVLISIPGRILFSLSALNMRIFSLYLQKTITHAKAKTVAKSGGASGIQGVQALWVCNGAA